MAYTYEKISGNQAKLTFTIPAEQVDEALQKAYLKLRGRINVPGFRKGKAPRKLIENMYGEAVFYDEALEIIFPDAYKEAVEKEDLHAVDQPQLDIQEMGSGKELNFTATVYVLPDVELGEYKGLTATKYLPPVTEEDIEKRMERDIRKVTTEQEVEDRAVQNGDKISLDYSGSVDGVKFDGGTAEKQELTIGSGAFIPGFEEQMVGMQLGEEKDITVTFPREYHAEELAGKEAVFHVKVNSIKEEIKPELNDDFAADVSDCKTFDEYKASLRKELEEIAEKNADAETENALIQSAVDASDCDIPEAMIEREVDNRVRSMEMKMTYQGFSMDMYLKYTGMTMEDVRDSFKTEARNTVKTQLVLEEIRKKEALSANDEQVDAEIEKYARQIGRELDAYKKSMSDRQKENFKDMADARLVIDLLKTNAKVTVKNEAAPKVNAEAAAEAAEAVIEQAAEEEEN